MEVMLTISGTPRWANGDKNPNIMPRRLADFTAFARAISTRYSGRFNGYLRALLGDLERAQPAAVPCAAVQCGRQVGRTCELREALRGAYTGIKAGNRLAKIAIGDVCARRPGDRPAPDPLGQVRRARGQGDPRLKFDAWSHHPYPFNPNSKPSQIVKWPNVSLASAALQRRAEEVVQPEERPDLGHGIRSPDEAGGHSGVPYATQAAYIQQSMAIAKRFPFVGCSSGSSTRTTRASRGSPACTGRGAPKGSSPSKFGASARPLDARNGVYAFRAGTLTRSSRSTPGGTASGTPRANRSG